MRAFEICKLDDRDRCIRRPEGGAIELQRITCYGNVNQLTRHICSPLILKEREYKAVGGKKGDDSKADEAREWLCENYYDIRMFGAVLVGKKGEGYNCGQVLGPAQLTFARSIDPVIPLDLSITRVALENRGDKPRESDDEKAATGTMGRKSLLPYGLYRGFGFLNPHFAKRTGVTETDLSLFWKALQMMWDLDRSASRGFMACRGLYVFTHDDPLGNAPAHVLTESVHIRRKEGNEVTRRFDDYVVSLDKELPGGVALDRLVG